MKDKKNKKDDDIKHLKNRIKELEKSETECRQAQDALRESEARHRDLFAHSPISLWEEDFSRVKEFLDDLRSSGVSDLTAHLKAHPDITTHCSCMVHIINVNKATINLFEAESKDEILGNLDKLFIDRSLEVFREEIITLYEGMGPFRGEITGKSLKGNLIDCVVQVTIFPGHEDSWSRVLVSVTDITKRKKAEEELKESEGRFRAFMDHFPSPIYIKDSKLRHIYANRVMIDDWQTSADKFIGTTSKDWFSKETAQKIEGFDQMVLHEQKAQEFDISSKLPSGAAVYYRDIKFPLPGVEGEKMLGGIALDITKGRQAEEKMTLLADAVMMSRDSIVLSDLEGKITFVNEATLKMCGIDDREDLIGRDSFEMVVPAERDTAKIGMEKLLKTGNLEEQEHHIITGNGDTISVEMGISIVKNAEGEPIGFAAVNRDITERRQAEKNLKKKLNELEIFNEAAVDRELIINQLRKEINELLNKAGQESKYEIVE